MDLKKINQRAAIVTDLFQNKRSEAAFVAMLKETCRGEDYGPDAQMRSSVDVRDEELFRRKWYRIRVRKPLAQGKTKCILYLHGGNWVLETGPQQFDADEIAVAGDSAGGGIALALCMYVRDQGLPQPNNLILLSPMVDILIAHTAEESAFLQMMTDNGVPTIDFKNQPIIETWWRGPFEIHTLLCKSIPRRLAWIGANFGLWRKRRKYSYMAICR